MGASINTLPATDIAQADQVPFFSASNGQDRRTSLNQLAQAVAELAAISGGQVTQYAAPSATGFSITVVPPQVGASVWLLITPTASFAAGTVVLPAAQDGQEVAVTTTQSIASLAVSGAGATVTGAPTSLAANETFTMRWDAVLSSWYPVVGKGAGGGGGGATNLSYTASPTNGVVASDTGTDATLPLSDGTNAGLMSPAQHTAVANISATAATAAQSAANLVTAAQATNSTQKGQVRTAIDVPDTAAVAATAASAAQSPANLVLAAQAGSATQDAAILAALMPATQVATSRTALASDNGATLELAAGVTYTLTNAVALPAGVVFIGPASGTAPTIAVTGSATTNGATAAITVPVGKLATAIPRVSAPAAFVVSVQA